MNRIAFSALMFSLAANPLWGQSEPAKGTTLRSHSRALSQRATTNKGLRFHHERSVLSAHSAVQYDLRGLKADEHPSDDQFAALMLRMQRLQAEVVAAMRPSQGQPPTADQIIKHLQASLGAASGTLRDDLNNLLIATLVNARRKGSDSQQQPYEDNTWVWSFRRLNRHENWGPVIQAAPNSILLIPVLNLLDKAELQAKTVPDFPIVDPVRSGVDADTTVDVPGGFDVINLHPHGMNVSPNWPSDNIFREIHPKQLKFYVYQIPPNQPAGTYFYHPHKHGAVATQVAGGMAGALIVRDPASGLDQLGEEHGWGAPTESVLMFQQLTLYKRDDSATDRFTRPDFFALKDVDVTLGQLCKERPDIRRIAQRMAGNATPSHPPIVRLADVETWVSGAFQPHISAKPGAFGEIRRLRLIHAGVEETINFTIRPMHAGAPAADIQVIAWDGVPLRQPYFVTEQQQLVLAPGNRADVLVRVPARPGIHFGSLLEYAILQRSGEATSENVLASLMIDPDLKPVETSRFVSNDEATVIYNSCAPKLSSPEVPNLEAFNVTFRDAAIDKVGHFVPGTFRINNVAFPGDQKFFRLHHSQNLALTVAGGDTSHPLHIHVNPVRVPADPDRGVRGQPSCEYWTDTILLAPNTPTNVTLPFNHWTGDAVVHCHILDHEDAGMMSLIHIRPDVLSWPEFPLGKSMEMPHVPQGTINDLRQSWPKAGEPISVSDPHRITVLFFMPPGSKGNACPHCSRSVQAIARFRQGIARPNAVRVVAVTATDIGAMPDPTALGLLADHDAICSDPGLSTFEPMGLIDGTPELNDDGELSFPHSFVPNTRHPIHVSDVMHGLFIIDARGMIVSARRAFSAFDDAAQIMREVELAARGQDAIRAAFKRAADVPKSGFAHRRLEIDRTRFEARLKSFEAMRANR